MIWDDELEIIKKRETVSYLKLRLSALNVIDANHEKF
jgi:hypothetical protein